MKPLKTNIVTRIAVNGFYRCYMGGVITTSSVFMACFHTIILSILREIHVKNVQCSNPFDVWKVLWHLLRVIFDENFVFWPPKALISISRFKNGLAFLDCWYLM